MTYVLLLRLYIQLGDRMRATKAIETLKALNALEASEQIREEMDQKKPF